MRKAGWFLLLLLMLMALQVTGCQEEISKMPADNSPLLQEGAVNHETKEPNKQEQFMAKPEQPDDEDVIEMVIQAHGVALEVFFTAFENGFLGIEPEPFEQVRPILIQHYSQRLVDTEFKAFYEEDLWAWGYEMHFAFPFFDRDNIIDLAVHERSDDLIEVRGRAYVNYDEYDTSKHGLIYENSRWVLDY